MDWSIPPIMRARLSISDLVTEKREKISKFPVEAMIEANLITVAMQPIVDVRTREIYGYEALARVRPPMVCSAKDLLTAAVEQKVMAKLGRALRQAAVRAGDGYRLFLNVHPDELDDELLTSSSDPLAAYEHPVVIEVPEAAPLDRYRYAHATFTKLRTKGVAIALDDFGAGYSNFSYLSTLAPDLVKLDRELIAGVRTGTRQYQLVRSLVELCTSQNAIVIAEGIETAEELAAVIDAGVPYAQGYFLGMPTIR